MCLFFKNITRVERSTRRASSQRCRRLICSHGTAPAQPPQQDIVLLGGVWESLVRPASPLHALSPPGKVRALASIYSILGGAGARHMHLQLADVTGSRCARTCHIGASVSTSCRSGGASSRRTRARESRLRIQSAVASSSSWQAVCRSGWLRPGARRRQWRQHIRKRDSCDESGAHTDRGTHALDAQSRQGQSVLNARTTRTRALACQSCSTATTQAR